MLVKGLPEQEDTRSTKGTPPNAIGNYRVLPGTTAPFRRFRAPGIGASKIGSKSETPGPRLPGVYVLRAPSATTTKGMPYALQYTRP